MSTCQNLTNNKHLIPKIEFPWLPTTFKLDYTSINGPLKIYHHTKEVTEMSESNKAVVRDYFAKFSAGKVDEALAMMSDDCTWWIAGKFELSGTKTKAEMAELLKGMGDTIPNGLAITIKGLTAEGDRVAVEAESYGELVNGKVYNNEYHFMIEMSGGKISAVREYLDTIHAKEILVAA